MEREAYAALAAVQHAISIGATKLLLKGDAKDLIEDLLIVGKPQTAAAEEIMLKTQSLLNHFVTWSVKYIPRAQTF